MHNKIFAKKKADINRRGIGQYSKNSLALGRQEDPLNPGTEDMTAQTRRE